VSDAFFNFAPFYDFVAEFSQYTRFVEVGVYTGASLTYLGNRLKQRGSDWTLIAVDLWERVNDETDYARTIGPEIRAECEGRIKANGLSDNVNLIQGDSVKASTMFRDQSIDFVFIDANHDYEHAKSDILAWLPKIKPGGTIAGHDILETTCGVEQAVKEIFVYKYKIMSGCWYVQV
jgi:predicted O-methyltransferase YrrM